VDFAMEPLQKKKFCRQLSVNECMFIHEAGMKCPCICDAKIQGGETGEGGGHASGGGSPGNQSSSSSASSSGQSNKNSKQSDNSNNQVFTATPGPGLVTPAPARNQLICFHADSTVITDRGVMSMSQLFADGRQQQQPIRIRSWDAATNQLVWSPFMYWLHADASLQAPFHQLGLDNGRTLTLTQRHLLYRSSTCQPDGKYEVVMAEAVRTGDCLLVQDDEHDADVRVARVAQLRTVQHTGIYAPVTATGTLLVDGVLASCYVENSHLLSFITDLQMIVMFLILLLTGFQLEYGRTGEIPLIPVAFSHFQSWFLA